MDINGETIEIIKKYYKYKDSKIGKAEFIKLVCNYFDNIKDDKKVNNYIDILMMLANSVGIPQYFTMLNNFQENEIEIQDISMDTLAAMLNQAKLTVSDNIMLHQMQYDFLKLFGKEKTNRYVLTAPTSFGKTFLVYEIIKKMDYKNIMLIFPTISLLSENYDKLLQNDDYIEIREKYKIHTLSNVQNLGERNIWIYTPERYMSYTDKNPNQKFDFVFIDEIYKIDNEFEMDDEVKENERDTAFRLALSYACENSKDILLAGPYIEFSNKEGIKNYSFNNFVKENNFEIINYNDYEIVDKEIIEIKNKNEYTIDNMNFDFKNIKSKFDKLNVILNSIEARDENAIIYCSTKSGAERYAKEFIERHNFKTNKNEEDNESFKTYNVFLEHIKEKFGEDWIVYKGLIKKIGIHHGLVPKYIQKQIIELFNRGVIKYIFSTTTITEGVNTSAKNIIITSDNKGRKELKHFDAQNIAGRAGRFTKHYKGNVIILSKKFEEILNKEGETIKHKNYDNVEKNEIDYYMTKDKYLSEKDKINKTNLEQEQQKRNIPDNIMKQFKAVGYSDKIRVYDAINSGKYDDWIRIFIMSINLPKMKLNWNGFEGILKIIEPIIPQNSKLYSLIENKTKSGYSILTVKLANYIEGGYYSLLQYQLENKEIGIDIAIRDTGDFVYNVLKYQLVKYLGVFDLMYRYIRLTKVQSEMDQVIGINKLLQILEYNALSDKARLVSDYGAPFNVIRSYEDNVDNSQSNFDDYELYIKNKIDTLLNEGKI